MFVLAKTYGAGSECIVCYANTANVAILPCRHFLCKTCVANSGLGLTYSAILNDTARCPSCRDVVQGFQKLDAATLRALHAAENSSTEDALSPLSSEGRRVDCERTVGCWCFTFVMSILWLPVLVACLALVVFSFSKEGGSNPSKTAEQIEDDAFERYGDEKKFSQLSKRDRVAVQIVALANKKKPSQVGHPRFAGRVFLTNFNSNTKTLKKFVEDDIVPYISGFAYNTNRIASNCVHFVTRAEQKDLRLFASIVNPAKNFRGGCMFRIVVNEEASENDPEINFAYKTLFKDGYLSAQEVSDASESPERFVNDGSRILVIATTRFEKTDTFIHGRSTQMFGYREDVGGMF